MPEPSFGLPSRRDFLRSSGGFLGWTWLSAHLPEAVRLAGQARRMASGRQAAELEFLTPEEFAEVEALCALIIPTDDLPGAREAGAAWFIDGSLVRYMEPVADGFRVGLIDLGHRLREAHPDARSLADLDPVDALAFVRGIEETPFFGLVWALTVWGTFALPQYGGNRGGAGWTMVGFEDRHAWQPPFGHYDRDAHGGEG